MALSGISYSRYVLGFLFLFCLSLSSQNASAVVQYDTRVMSGDSAPGIDSSIVFDSLRTGALINDSGEVVFHGLLDGPGISSHGLSGVWSDGGGVVREIALEGKQAIGMDAGVYYSPMAPKGASLNIDNVGRVVFSSTVYGTGIDRDNDRAIWRDDEGSTSLILQKGSLAPGTEPGTSFNSNINRLSVGLDKFAFTSALEGPSIDETNDFGIWSWDAGTLGPLMREGDVVPGSGGAQVFTPFSIEDISSSGHLVIYAGITEQGTGSYKTSLWTEINGELQLIVQSQTAAPDTGPGVLFQILNPADGRDSISINDAGQIAFLADVSGDDVDTTNRRGIWSQGSGTLHKVAREGDQVPGYVSGVTFDNVQYPIINNQGQTAFLSRLAGPGIDTHNDLSYWMESGGALIQIVREGDPAPGTEPGTLFERLAGYSYEPTPLLNNNGQIGFVASLTGPSIHQSNRQGFWAMDPDGKLTLVVREGDLFDVNDNPWVEDLRTIESFRFSYDYLPVHNYRSSVINNASQVAFSLTFTDGTSGIFVATIGLDGDLDGDGFVGIDDLNAVLSNWNQSVTPGDLSSGDYNQDGFIGVDDLNGVLVNWNRGIPPGNTNTAAIPEPGTLCLFSLGALWAGCRSR